MFESYDKTELVALPKSDTNNCFGCSPHIPSGLHMDFFTNGKSDAVVSWLAVPEHLCGWANMVHGGIVTLILDEAMGWASLIILKKIIFTKSLTVDFKKPLLVGEQIRVEANIRQFISEREAVTQGWIYNHHNELCSQAQSIMVQPAKKEF